MRIEAASGILLLTAAAVALGWANSPWAERYFALRQTPVGFRFGAFLFERTLEWVVNDVLMVIFFFVIGLEIRREVYHGELSDGRRAALPAFAAVGGMVVPAALYLAVADLPTTRSGWGVPMATDIAFAVGILTLLGKRVPAALRVLLLALAVIDDLGAILVIALFYSPGVEPTGLFIAGGGLIGLLAMQRIGVRAKAAYVIPSAVTWAGIYAAGIHPTIAGVIIGLMTPVQTWFGPDGFVAGVREQIEQFDQTGARDPSSSDLTRTLRKVNEARREAMSPAESLIETLHPWVAYGIMPTFALANSGVAIAVQSMNEVSGQVVGAVTIGLLVGKPLGILTACWLAQRLRLGVLPRGLTFKHLSVLGVVAGVGFTMALFIAHLAFVGAEMLPAAKLGVLFASTSAGLLALLLGRVLLMPVADDKAAQTVDEAERSTET